MRDAIFRQGIIRPDEKVLCRIALNYTAQLAAVDTDELCFDLYQSVKALPSTITRMQIAKQCGITLNGPAYENNPNLLVANDDFGRPSVVKVLKVREGTRSYAIRKEESQREELAVELLQLSNPSNLRAFVHAEVMTIIQQIDEDEFMFKALKMPRYHVLIQCASFSMNIIAREGRRLVEAVAFIHAQGYVHMDIKGSNICVDTSGQWLLGDFGSVCPIGSPVTSSTIFLCKENVIGLQAHPKYDWFMLLVTLMIETLEDRNAFQQFLYDNSHRADNFISENRLRELIRRITCAELLSVIGSILDNLQQLDQYFILSS